MKTFGILILVSVLALNIGARSARKTEPVKADADILTRLVSVEDYEEVIYARDIEKIEAEIQALKKKAGASEKAMERLEKKRAAITAKAEKELNFRWVQFEDRIQNYVSNFPNNNAYGPLRDAINENLDFAINFEGKAIKFFEAKFAELENEYRRTQSKLSQDAKNEFNGKIESLKQEIKGRQEKQTKLREVKTKLDREMVDDAVKKFQK